MMAWLQAALLGVLQGLTEFLPVSSSGHLVVFQELMPVAGDEVLFDLVLHVGTLLPALWFFRADVVGALRDLVGGEAPFWERPGVRLAVVVVLASIPTALIGLGFKDHFEALFDRPDLVAGAFLATAALLAATHGREDGPHAIASLPAWAAVAIGVAQGVAITPGISRSGATIAAALLLGVRRAEAVKLSFLMSVPAILGAVALKSGDVQGELPDAGALIVGFLAAMVSGYGALVLLVRLVARGRLAWFAGYLVVMAGVAFSLSLSR